jgi:hypothetical protein
VAARRLIILMLVLLAISSVAAALVPVDPEGLSDESTTISTHTPKRELPAGRLVPKTIDADRDHPKTVRIELGDQLQLRVTSRRADQVEIPRVGELQDVDRFTPAEFDLLPFEPGSYPVRLVEAKRKVGRILVTRPKPKRAGAKN